MGVIPLECQEFKEKAIVIVFIVFLLKLQNSMLLEIPEGKPQIGKPCWLPELRVLAQGTELAEPGLH